MAVSHWLLTSVLFLLLFITPLPAQLRECYVDNDKPSVYENNPSGYVVTRIHAGQGVTVTIDPSYPDAKFFTIQGSELQLKQSVDYEEVTVLLVSLTCQNTAGEQDSLQIVVTILNVNDNIPVFQELNLSRAVPEDTKVNAVIVARESLSASDADLDTIFYELVTTVVGTDGYFAIRGLNNPEIYLQKALDYEKFKLTTLLLYARDRPEGSTDVTHTATATIEIVIEQADTKPPWFLPCTFINTDRSVCISSPYAGRVNMGEMSREPLSLEPGPIYAIDPDYMIKEKVVYSIVGGNTENIFSVDANSGNLTMNKVATAPGSYLLQVMATQVNNIQKYAVVSVEIKVINNSDYPPHFETRIYNGTVAVGLAPGSFVYQAGDPSKPLMITAMDEDFPDKVNPNIEYYVQNSTDFISTKDGLILTNVVLHSPGTVAIEAVGKDLVSLQKASTVIVVEIIPAAVITSPDTPYTAQDMAVLGGTLAALLLIALVILGVMVYKQCGKPVKHLIRKKFSKEISGGYQNQAYQDEHPDVSSKQHEISEYSNAQEPRKRALEHPALSLASSNAEEIDSYPKVSVASTIISDQEEKEKEEKKEEEKEKEEKKEEEEEMEEETGHEKEVKSILKTDRHVADDGYKAVWFKTDVDPDAEERVEVIEDNAAHGDDDSDQDLQMDDKEEDEEEDEDHRGLGVSFASKISSPPAAETIVDISEM